MKKVALLLLTTAVAFLLFSCKNGNGNNPDNPSNQPKAKIVHKYTITSETPIEITLVGASGGDDIFVNGEDEKTSVIQKKLNHTGTKEYSIQSNTAGLSTAFVASHSGDEKVPVQYTWKVSINGREIKSDTQSLLVDSGTSSKQYVTYSNEKR